jgi:hypothetical protein
MPAKMHSFYLRRMYQQNDLIKPGAIELIGTPIDLRKIKVPSYMISTREDHIAPWKSTYRGTQVLGGPKRFVLAASGHIAGVVNPPDSGKYSHWTSESLPPNPRTGSPARPRWPAPGGRTGSAWVTAINKDEVPARLPGSGAAPGDRGCARPLRPGHGDRLIKLPASAFTVTIGQAQHTGQGWIGHLAYGGAGRAAPPHGRVNAGLPRRPLVRPRPRSPRAGRRAGNGAARREALHAAARHDLPHLRPRRRSASVLHQDRRAPVRRGLKSLGGSCSAGVICKA